MYKIGIIGHRPEYISDKAKGARTVDRVIDLISYQYGENLIISIGGDIGVEQWALNSCSKRNTKYHLFLPCAVDVFSENWYDEQKAFLNECFKNAWAVTIHSDEYNTNTEKETYKYIVDTSNFIICFWNGMLQGPVFNTIEYALEKNKLIVNGFNDLKLVTNEDIQRK